MSSRKAVGPYMSPIASIFSRLREPNERAPHIRMINIVAVVLASLFSLLLLQTTHNATEAYNALYAATAQYLDCSEAAQSLKDASDYLTMNARIFTVTGEIETVSNYYTEINVTQRRDSAIAILDSYANDAAANRYINAALAESNDLSLLEARAMRLVAEAHGYAIEGDLQPLSSYTLTDEERSLSPEEQIALAQELLFGKDYREHKDAIDKNVELCTAELVGNNREAQLENAERLESLLVRERILTAALLVTVMLIIFMIITLILWPLASYSKLISERLPLIPSGAQELQTLAKDYNQMYEENQRRSDHLRHRADHDSLTGLFNRGAYDALCATHTTNVALMLVDVDYFKSVNDTYGHEVGDEILRKVAFCLTNAFRASDYPCRIGGDEFAVIITDITPDLRNVIIEKIGQIANKLLDTSDGLPATTLSIGVAFSESVSGHGSIFNAADRALYLAKDRGKNGYAFSDDPDMPSNE